MTVSAIMLECQCLHGTKLIAEERDRRNLSNYRTWAYVNDITKQLQTQTFSFQQSCINQIMTQSIGIRLKTKIGDKKPQTDFGSSSVRKTSLIVHSGFKTIKNLLAALVRQAVCEEVCQTGWRRKPPQVTSFSSKIWTTNLVQQVQIYSEKTKTMSNIKNPSVFTKEGQRPSA